VQPGVGLRSMRCRAAMIGAELKIESRIDGGTEVSVSCTLARDAPTGVS